MKNIDKKHTLKLRFLQFIANKWDYTKAKDIFFNSNEKNCNLLNLPLLSITQDNGAIPRECINYNVIIDHKNIKNYKIVKKGDFIISLRSFQGGIEYSLYNGLCSPAYIIIRKKENKNYYDKFFRYLFKTKPFIQKLNKYLTGIRDGKIISYNYFSNIYLPVPTIPEQQKIADCLSSLDELIEAYEQKLDALKQHKKGLIQRLFPAEGETTPRWRFSEFRNTEEWENIALGKLLMQSPDYGVNSPAVPYSSTLPTYIRITDISDNGKFIKEKRMSVNIEVTENIYLHTGDIVLARTGASVGKSYKYQETDGSLVFAGFLIRISPDINKSNSEFINQFFHTQQYWNWVHFTSMRSGQPGINGTEYASLPVPIPSLPEQQKIADCLSSLDEQMESQEEKIAALKEHKKGMMQQLFPSL